MDQIDDTIAKFLPYLQEIQKKLLIVFVVMVTTGAIAGYNYQSILKFVMQFFHLDGVQLVMTSPYQFINLAVNTGFAVGVTFGVPLIIFFLIRFVKPALKPSEYKLLLQLYPASIILFLSGFLFGSWLIQFVIQIYAQTTLELAVQNYWDVGSFLTQILTTGLSVALVFELPIILLALLQLKLVKHEAVVASRRYIYIAILIFAVVLPPTDILSLIFLTIPPLFLFESTLILNQIMNKRSNYVQ